MREGLDRLVGPFVSSHRYETLNVEPPIQGEGAGIDLRTRAIHRGHHVTSIQTISQLKPIAFQLSEDLGTLASKLFGATHIDEAFGQGTNALFATDAGMRSAAENSVRTAFKDADPQALIARLTEVGKGADGVNLYRHDLGIYANGLREATASNDPSDMIQAVRGAQDGVEMLLHRIDH